MVSRFLSPQRGAPTLILASEPRFLFQDGGIFGPFGFLWHLATQLALSYLDFFLDYAVIHFMRGYVVAVAESF